MTTRWVSWGWLPTRSCSSATPGAGPSRARAPLECARFIYSARSSRTTRPCTPTTNCSTTSTEPRIWRSCCRSSTPTSVAGTPAPFPVRRARRALQHLHRAREREWLGTHFHGLRDLVAGDPLAGVRDDFEHAHGRASPPDDDPGYRL